MAIYLVNVHNAQRVKPTPLSEHTLTTSRIEHPALSKSNPSLFGLTGDMHHCRLQFLEAGQFIKWVELRGEQREMQLCQI